MNIGIFTDTYSPQINGVSTSVRMLEKELTDRGHKVYIFTTSDPKAKKNEHDIFRLPSMPFVFLPTHRMCLMYSPLLLMRIKFLKLDIVHTQTEFPLGVFGKIVSEFYKIPLVHTYHTMYEDYVHYIANGHLITPRLAQKFSRIFCNAAQIVISPVSKTKNKLLEYGVKKPIKIIPTGIDFEPFNPDNYAKKSINDLKLSFGIDLDSPVIIMVGRVAKEKSMDVLIKQMPKILNDIPKAKLVVIGDGPVKSELEQLSKDLNIDNSVLFVGAVPWDEIGQYYLMGDVFVTASTSETQGLTHIEAMAAYVPVIAKRDASFEEVIVDDKTGLYFEDDEELSTLVVKILHDEKKRERLAYNARKSISHLSSKHFAETMEKLYSDVIESHGIKKKK